jgi:CDP-glycerol glycerophosphotransferase (TagB/SpsB family)
VDLSDRERRFVVMNASNDKKGDTDYWQMIRKELFNEASGKSVANWLLERDLSSLDFNVLPENAYQDVIVETRMSSEQLFIRQWDGMECRGSDLHTLYLDYCRNEGLPYESVVTKFGAKLMNMVKNGDIQARRLASGVHYKKN